MSNWLQNDLADLAKFVEADAEELAVKAADALLPTLALDLAPIVQKAVTNALGTFPFGSGLAPVVSEAVTKVVDDLLTAIQDKLDAAVK
jgi:hypothetical protein